VESNHKIVTKCKQVETRYFLSSQDYLEISEIDMDPPSSSKDSTTPA